jgi:hypothetical protein
VWDAIEFLWNWLDNEYVEQPYDEDRPIGEREPWWEKMVEILIEDQGVVGLN